MNSPWKIVFEGSLIAVERHETKGYEHAIRPPGVRLILTNDAGEILLTKEYRDELGKQDVRLPGGKVYDDLASWLAARGNDAAIAEAVLRAGRLEGKQEAGVDEIESLTPYAISVAGASVEWDLHYLTGRVIRMGEQELEEDEKDRGIEVGFYAPEAVGEFIRSGALGEDRTAGVLARYLNA